MQVCQIVDPEYDWCPDDDMRSHRMPSTAGLMQGYWLLCRFATDFVSSPFLPAKYKVSSSFQGRIQPKQIRD